MKWLRFLCACLLLSAVVALSFAAKDLPSPRDGRVQQMYARFSGVLRLWVCEGWQCGAGSLSAWLNEASARFERKNDGVYVQVTRVSPETLRAFNYAAENPPDMLLFPPGLLAGADDLLCVDADDLLRSELRAYANGRATPVAMGGYAWAINRDRVREGGAGGAGVLLPIDAQASSFSCALAALLCGDEAANGAGGARYGVDLGLPAPTLLPRAPGPTPAHEEIVPGAASARAENAYARFARGDADATVVTQREIRRLQLLSDAGRAPEWEILRTGPAFTDQLALLGVTDIARTQGEARREMSEKFLRFLLSPDAQGRLASVRALRVTDGPALYAGQPGMRELERGYMENALLVPPAFESRFRERAGAAAEELIAGKGGAQAALDAILADF